ncbi:MAG TPA: cation:proton antiporter [Sphaerochaeta sp.]|nr:cation:proton antiporter [Sphaerochaeta sp.]
MSVFSQLPLLLIAGIMMFVAFYMGKLMAFIKLPSLIGYMVTGVLLGPSLINFISEPVQGDLSFITDIALSFVAVSIGLELSLASLKRQGSGIITVIFAESLLAFIVVMTSIYALTGDLSLALVFGSVAPASAPAGTVAIIQEYKAKGKLTEALYAVVGFDDGLGIIIFGFASAIAQSLLHSEMGGVMNISLVLLEPLKEVLFSVVIGVLMGWLFSSLVKRLHQKVDVFILLFSQVFIVAGLCTALGLSEILTNMIFGIIIVNTQSSKVIHSLKSQLQLFMPLIFVLFFTLAGANLHLSALPSLGLIGAVYILGRSSGLMAGAYIGSVLGRMESTIRKYLGMGILSQAGVAIGLALVVKQEFTPISAHGASIGVMVITTVTATSIFFEIIGPILTKIGLTKAGEIRPSKGGRQEMESSDEDS